MSPRARLRTPIVLLGAMLLAIVAVAGLTVRLLQGERAVLDAAVKRSQDQSGTLLAHQVEQALTSATSAPFLAYRQAAAGLPAGKRPEWLKATFPQVALVLVLDQNLRVSASFPKPHGLGQRRLNAWLAQRVRLEGSEPRDDGMPPQTFLDEIDGRPALFGLQAVAASDTSRGWLLLRFDLDALLRRHVAPLLTGFGAAHGGSVALTPAGAALDTAYLVWPIGRVLPGWSLGFHPDGKIIQQGVQHHERILISIASAVALAMIMATFSVWREIRREHALVALRNRFVANVSHELKTPLALIRMYAETLYLNRLKDKTRVHDYHRTILRESERLTQMIDTLLDFARLQQKLNVYQLTDMDLGATVTAVLQDYTGQLEERGLRIQTRIDADLPLVAHDRRGVTQILLNLLDNAAKYGGSDGPVQVHLCGDRDWVELRVVDFGPGIPPQERLRVRKAFYRSDDAHPAQGSGLGLALVEQIAEAHHAHFILDTPESGHGVTATVSFPSYKVPR
jgi:signal transduction histidine kinase